MTTTLVMALFVEGKTDERFLPILIQRVAEYLILNYGLSTVDILEPILIASPKEKEYRTNAERILLLAQKTAGYHMLIIHSDADFPSADRALAERFQPGLELIREAQLANISVCRHVLPIIPIQMIEAWMLADALTLHSVIGTRLTVNELGLPQSPQQVESIPRPKQALLRAVELALRDRPRRRRHPQQEIVILQEPLARQIRLDELRKVPAFRSFESALHLVLQDLRLAHE